MQKLLDYAYLTIDKENRDKAIEDYQDIKGKGAIRTVSHSQAVKNIHTIKKDLGLLISRLPKNLMISGSTALACVIKNSTIVPHDIDLYMKDNDHNTVCQIDEAIRQTYSTEIIITRTQYTINWFLKDAEFTNYPNVQLVLPTVRHWSEVFSSYHCDLVCIGFLVGEEKFIYGKGRWDRFYETGVSYGTTSFIDEEYKSRVIDAVAKYRNYGFTIDMVNTDAPIVHNQIENSPRVEVKSAFEDIEQFILKNPSVQLGKFLHNVYSGEIFKDYIETMSIFNCCPTCNNLIVERKICEDCSQDEDNKVKFVQETLAKSDKDLKYLVTGGRCGLGNQISKVLIESGRDVTVTSRFPDLAEGKKAVALDLKDPKSVAEFEKIVGEYDVLVLSAAETLHYARENLITNMKNPSKKDLDWTNDFHRNDTGIWHKCIDEHTDEEIEDPIQINITSIAKIIRSFVGHQLKHKSNKQKSIIYVTSSEGLFIEKSPFHPITNMTKSAMEQLIWTMKRQADVLGMNVVMADPGWMYTKSTNGKNVGPISLEWGAAQVLLPLAKILNGEKVENASLWSRKKKNAPSAPVVRDEIIYPVKFKGHGQTCDKTLEETNVMYLIRPCGHKTSLKGWYQNQDEDDNVQCPICNDFVRSVEVVYTDEKNENTAMNEELPKGFVKGMQKSDDDDEDDEGGEGDEMEEEEEKEDN